jgi:predicted transcriptional regulator
MDQINQDQKFDQKKQNFGKAICLFLAEGMRSREIGLARAADIAEKVVSNINLIDTEEDFYNLIKELSKDFEELKKLNKKLVKAVKNAEQEKMEKSVKEYVSRILSHDSKLALTLMQEACKPGANLQNLREQFPSFDFFIKENENEHRKP